LKGILKSDREGLGRSQFPRHFEIKSDIIDIYVFLPVLSLYVFF